ncbi:MAG: tRNA (adenosine(37)-N6)-threonylcarbamoyltransferase complex dimerization subunit type 1 TsaB [Actinobacteria bacterium]|nr:tRNA (adenosine(37)-N6)-threonylcarbamoyltransferase complex dimerization subunit type 1 TsaB [Actinomycetota bacterium]
MVTLALDTASAWSSVAVVDGDVVVAEAEHHDPRGHAEVLATLVLQVLARAGQPQIDVVACGVGPGPYTGLRIGVTTAQVLGLAWRVPVVGICSLDAIAASALGVAAASGAFVVATDARRGEVYWASYSATGERMTGPFVGRQEEADETTGALPWIGERAGEQQVSAGVLGALANRLLSSGATPGAPVRTLSTHGTDDGSMAGELTGQRLLAPFPLYVRRPDAMPVGGS